MYKNHSTKSILVRLLVEIGELRRWQKLDEHYIKTNWDVVMNVNAKKNKLRSYH